MNLNQVLRLQPPQVTHNFNNTQERYLRYHLPPCMTLYAYTSNDLLGTYAS